MKEKITEQVALAKTLCHAGRIQEAYQILRRFYDRLPFAPTTEHAECMGLFCAVLLDLKREFDLNFYIRELERLSERANSTAVTYALAVAYFYGPEPRTEQVRRMLHAVVEADASPSVCQRARMMLAVLYLDRDFAASKHQVALFRSTGDVYLERLQAIWRAVIARRERRFDEARKELAWVFESIGTSPDWYGFYSAEVILGLIEVDCENLELAGSIRDRIRIGIKDLGNRPVLEQQLLSLNEALDRATAYSTINLEVLESEIVFVVGDRRVSASTDQTAQRLLRLFAENVCVDKRAIVKALYGREYSSGDDKLIYYHVHALRKQLRQLGLPTELIKTEKNGYRWVKEMKWKEETT